MTRSLYVASSLLLVLLLARCDSAVTPGEPQVLVPTNSATLTVNSFHLPVDSTGKLGTILRGPWSVWRPDGFPIQDGASTLYAGGLWLAAVQAETPRASMVWLGSATHSNFVAEVEGTQTGLYYVTPDLLRGEVANWPVAFGAPVDAQGRPRLYGDAMIWSAMTSKAVADIPLMAAPLDQVRVTQAIYGYDDQSPDALRNAVFVRYTVTNTSNAPLDELYAGFFADTDLGYRLDGCPGRHGGDNNTGYAPGRALSYTYSVLARGDQDQQGCPVVVSGVALLEAPGAASVDDLVASHRILRKNDYVNPDFGEGSLDYPGQVMLALRGLSNSGQPMIDPTTGTQTKFAFTGDPVAGTGWLDVDSGIDVRSLLAAHPFSLAPGETKTITVLLTAGWGDRLSAALEHLNTQVDYVRSHPDLWQF